MLQLWHVEKKTKFSLQGSAEKRRKNAPIGGERWVDGTKELQKKSQGKMLVEGVLLCAWPPTINLHFAIVQFSLVLYFV